MKIGEEAALGQSMRDELNFQKQATPYDITQQSIIEHSQIHLLDNDKTSHKIY